MKEVEIQRKIIDVLKYQGAIVFRMNAGRGAYNQHLCPPGTPDLLAILPSGDSVWIEVKTESGKLSDKQKEMIAHLEARGQEVVVARNAIMVEKFLQKMQ